MSTSHVWFITGASKGFGLEMTHQLLRAGHRVAATSRSLDGLQQAVGDLPDTFLPLEVDLLSESSVAAAVDATLAAFGRIDVVVNNAGYGQLGSLEELSMAEARQNFDVNVFGTLNVIRHVMPQLRAQQSGHIVNISSIAGITGNFPGWGVYCGSKFAVEGMSESLAAEVKPFGIKVTVVEPGYFRTDFLKDHSMNLPAHRMEEYATVRESETFHADHMAGNQPGDPAKAVAAIIDMTASDTPPLHLILGPDAYGMAEQKIAALQQDMEAWQAVSRSTDFAE